MATFSEFIDRLDPDAGKRGKQFERFVKWFLQTDPEWASQLDQIWLWEEYPERWGIDCGVDLVFRHRNGETWAVQAKCYSEAHDITKHDVDKFLSESNRKGIDKRLLIATTDRMGANAKQVCDAQEKQVVRYLRSNFDAASVDYPSTIADLHRGKRKDKPQPREHQREAIEAVAEALQCADRGQLIMACGTGKTFTTLWIKEHLAANSTLMLLPSLGLLSQTLREWTLAANHLFEVLCVCSDDTVGKRGADEFIHSVTELPFPVTSDTHQIRSFLLRDGPRVVFSTYQSLALVAEAQFNNSAPEFDLIVADEAHRCSGKVNSDFATVLDAKRIRGKRRLFATATPRTYSTGVKKTAEGRGIEVVGMDDEAVFGKVLYSLPFGEAIKRELLTDYRVVIIGVDNPTIAAWIENRELLKTDTGIQNDAESLAAQIGLLKAFKDYDLRRVISFHSRVSRAESFAADLHGVAEWVGHEHKPSGVLKTDFVSGDMATDKRRRKLGQLKGLGSGERGLLSNARCLSEGVDVPSLDGVAFVDPRSSQIDIIQAVGRAIRLSPNKQVGTIILPVFIEGAESPEGVIEPSRFKPVWDVLNALRAHDDVLAAEVDQMRVDLGNRAGSTVSTHDVSKITIDLPESVDPSFGDALRTHLVENITDSWEFWFGLLQSFAQKHGHCLVRRDFVSAQYKLGQWVNSQRTGRDILPAARKARLEQLPGWVWNQLDAQWDERFAQLQTYAVEHGDCLVPTDHVLATGDTLGKWVNVQRVAKCSGKLSGERAAKLDALAGWSWDAGDAKWETGFSCLKQYTSEHPNLFIARNYVAPDEFPLGQWVSVQRIGKNKLPLERRERLEALPGWSWDARADQWDIGYAHLCEYAKGKRDWSINQSYKLPDGFRLGVWVNTQRTNQNALTSERRQKLEALEGWIWNAREQNWLIGMNHLKTYLSIEGHCRVPHKYLLDGFPLGQWVTDRRQARKKGTLLPERVAKLDALPGWVWNARPF